MNKQEFLEEMRGKLLEELPPMEAAYQVQYYEEYIDTEIRSGHSEEEVLGALGDPYLIARTLIDNPDSRAAYDSVVIPEEPKKPYKEPEKPRYGAYGGMAYEMPPEEEAKTAGQADTAEKMTGDVERELDAEKAAKREKFTKTLTIVAIAAVVLAILGLLLKVLAKALPVILIVIVVIGILDVLRNKLH